MTDPVPMMMLVLNLDVGGQERMLIELSRALDADRFRPLICCLEGRGVLAATAEAAGLEVLALEKPEGFSLRTAGQLRTLIRSRGIRLVHSHNNPGLLYGALSTAGSTVVHVHTKHGVGSVSASTKWLNWLSGLTAKSVVPVSEALLDQCANREGIPRRKLTLINNGVDLTPYLNIAREPGSCSAPVIGHVARLTAIKNQGRLLALFSSFLEHYPAARLVIVGDGPERAALEAKVQQAGIGDQVEFAGLRTDIDQFMRGFDWFALTSDSEGTPISVIEAMAAGLPITSTRVGGMADVVEEGVTGFLAAPDDHAKLLQDWLRLAQDPLLRHSLGAQARAYAQSNYGIGKMVTAYQQLYQQALG
ncbi:MAG: glycosyltransferase [Pseudomonadota bacterium]